MASAETFLAGSLGRGYLFRKWVVRKGMSSARSRSGGTSILITWSR